MTVPPTVHDALVSKVTDLGFSVRPGVDFDTWYINEACDSLYSDLPDIEYTIATSISSADTQSTLSVSPLNYLYEEHVPIKGSYCFLKVQNSTNTFVTLGAPFLKNFTVKFYMGKGYFEFYEKPTISEPIAIRMEESHGAFWGDMFVGGPLQGTIGNIIGYSSLGTKNLVPTTSCADCVRDGDGWLDTSLGGVTL